MQITVIGANSPTGQSFVAQALGRQQEVLATTTKNTNALQKIIEETFELDDSMKQNIQYVQANVMKKETLLQVLEGQGNIYSSFHSFRCCYSHPKPWNWVESQVEEWRCFWDRSLKYCRFY